MSFCCVELGFGLFSSAPLRRWLLLALATCVVLVPAKQSFQAQLAELSGPGSLFEC